MSAVGEDAQVQQAEAEAVINPPAARTPGETAAF